MNYNSLSIEKFQELFLIRKVIPETVEDRIERDIQTLSVLTGKSEDYFESLPVGKLKSQISKAAFLEREIVSPKIKRVVWMGDTRYVAKTDVSQYTTEQYLSLKTHLDNPIANLHKMLAIIYEPTFQKVTDQTRAKAEAGFLKIGIGLVYGAFFLFAMNSRRLNLNLVLAQNKARETLNSHLREVEGSLSQTNLAGIT